MIFEYNEVFEPDPDNPDNLLLNIPPQVLERTGWLAGDTLRCTVEDGALVLQRITQNEFGDL